ncbi:MAG: class I SAM-dependent methyltransferase [Gaiellaceae bacterium]
MDKAEYRRQSFEGWNAMAHGWERRRAQIDEITAPVREWLVEALASKPGETILELAAGPGDTGFQAAGLLGESGTLISSDFSHSMVEVARRRAAELGLENVEHRTLDAERIELPNDSVDGVLCRFGYMLMPDPEAALAETRRVLRPGGRLALAVWRDAAQNPWVALAGRMLTERGLVPPPEPDAPGMFVMASDERMRELLMGAGFTVERLEDVPVRFVYETVEEYVGSARDTGGTFARAWDAAADDERESITAGLGELFAPFVVDGRYELPGLAFCALAR